MKSEKNDKHATEEREAQDQTIRAQMYLAVIVLIIIGSVGISMLFDSTSECQSKNTFFNCVMTQ